MLSALVSIGLAAMSLPPAPPATAQATCAALGLREDGEPASALARAAQSALAARDFGRAEELADRALHGPGPDTARAWALRMLVDLRLPRGALDELGAILACEELRGEVWTHARAWLAYRQGRYAEAAGLLQPLVRPRHHSQPRWSIVHEDLGDAYAQLGREADAQAQWRIALATDYDPGETGWDRASLERKLAGALAEAPAAPPLLPLQYYEDAVSLLDMASIERTPAGVKYSKLVLLRNDERGAAFGIDSWEVRCDSAESRVLAVHSFAASGETVRTIETPTPWRPDLHGEPWLGTERRLACAAQPGMPLAARGRSNIELLQRYRAGEPLLE